MRIKIVDEIPAKPVRDELEARVTRLEERVAELTLELAKRLTSEEMEALYWRQLALRKMTGLPPEAVSEQVVGALTQTVKSSKKH